MEIIKTAIWSKARSTHLFAVLMLPRVAADANASQCRRLSAVPHDKLALGKYRIDARGNFSSTCDIITVFVIIYLPPFLACCHLAQLLLLLRRLS